MAETSELHITNIPRADKGRWVAASRAAGSNLASWAIITLNNAASTVERQITQPAPAEIKAARIMVGLTQTEAAFLVHASLKTWQNWESESGESRKIPLAAWELFLIKKMAVSCKIPCVNVTDPISGGM